MSNIKSVFKKPEERNRQILFWFLRLFIIISIFIEIYLHRDIFVYIEIIVFLLTFLPFLIRKFFSLSLPLGIEILFLISLVITIYGEKLLAGIFVQIILGAFFGFIGFMVLYTLNYNSKFKLNNNLIAFFSFCLSVSVGTIWEVVSYFLGILTPYHEFKFTDYNIPFGLFSSIIGAAIISFAGFIFVNYGSGALFQKYLKAFIEKNPKLVSNYEKSPEYVSDIIQHGENKKIEFKSTLRTNLHTKNPDKKIEHSILKTITAFLNSEGGTLLIGVDDKGNIIGTEDDGFNDTDRFMQHYSNLINNHIGKEYIPFIDSSIIEINDKKILKTDCNPSNKEVFLKINDTEEFYVRVGPASVKLEGSKLINYVNKKFKRE